MRVEQKSNVSGRGQRKLMFSKCGRKTGEKDDERKEKEKKGAHPSYDGHLPDVMKL